MGNYSKAIGAGLGGAAAVIVSWVAAEFGGVSMPLEVQGAMSIIFSTGATFFAPSNG